MLITSMELEIRRLHVSLSRNLYFYLPLTIVLMCFCEFQDCEGTVTLTPSTVLVCSGTEQFELMCTTPALLLQWSTDLFSDRPPISREAPTDQTYSVQVNSTVFTFSRISSQYDVPQVSRLLVSPVSHSLSGTVLKCEDVFNRSNVASTILNIIADKDPEEANVTVLSAQHERHGVVVTLGWTQESSVCSYHVSASPQSEMRFNGSTRVQLTVLYNMPYNVTVVTSLCGRNNTFIKHLQYFKADHCRILNPLIFTKHLGQIVDGSNLSLACSPGMVLKGPSTSLCLESGEWEPDPREAVCTGSSFQGQTIDGKIAVASSVSSFAVGSVIFFIIGFLCGYLYLKQKQSSEPKHTPPLAEGMTPVYEEITVKQREHELELQKNMAYGPL